MKKHEVVTSANGNLAPFVKAPCRAHKDEKQEEVALPPADSEFQRIYKAVLASPDGRETKVAEIKKRIQQGSYTISPEALVDKLLPALKRRQLERSFSFDTRETTNDLMANLVSILREEALRLKLKQLTAS
jgi:flagellar biosynthesis anti-sigma factor FlgM